MNELLLIHHRTHHLQTNTYLTPRKLAQFSIQVSVSPLSYHYVELNGDSKNVSVRLFSYTCNIESKANRIK